MAHVGSIMRGSGYKGFDNPKKNTGSLAFGSPRDRTNHFACKIMENNSRMSPEAAVKYVEKYGYDYK